MNTHNAASVLFASSLLSVLLTGCADLGGNNAASVRVLDKQRARTIHALAVTPYIEWGGNRDRIPLPDEQSRLFAQCISSASGQYKVFGPDEVDAALRRYYRKHPEVQVTAIAAFPAEHQANENIFLKTKYQDKLSLAGLVASELPVDAVLVWGIPRAVTCDRTVFPSDPSGNLSNYFFELTGTCYDVKTGRAIWTFHGSNGLSMPAQLDQGGRGFRECIEPLMRAVANKLCAKLN